MGKKHLSLIIVPHDKTGSRTLSFSKRAVKVAQWAGIAAGVLILGITADYVRLHVNRVNARSLAAVNAQQKAKLAEYEASLGVLQKQVASLDEYRKKINMLAGIRSSDDLKSVGTGGRSLELPDGQSAPGAPPVVGQNSLKGIQDKATDIKKNLSDVAALFQAKTAQLSCTPSIYPTSGILVSAFGWRIDPFTQKQAFHYGLDIAAAFNNPIVATADGVVIAINEDKLLGKSVQINHGYGVTTVFGHMAVWRCRVGQKVKRGDVIGEVGQTGKANGPHVHYEVRVNGAPVNPFFYILEEQ